MKPIQAYISFALLIVSVNVVSAQTPCEDGSAGSYPCLGIDLLSHISAQDLQAEEHQGIWLNDIWGWTDPMTNKEYAIIGMSNGTSFVDVTDPINPVFLGILNEHNFTGRTGGRLYHDGAKSVWRDIKVYKNHAYIVSEDKDHGMQVFDLTELRGVTIPMTFSETANYQGISNAHNIVINETTGFAYIVGATRPVDGNDCSDGGLHIVDISDPANPVYRACFDLDGYTHDAQCVIYTGPDTEHQGKEICFNANENSITLVDVNDKDNITMISRKAYTNVEYAHQGWLTEDQKYFITNDELDEYNNKVSNTRTLIWDVQDLDNPALLDTYSHAGSAIDHNLYIVDHLMYQSNYTSGLRVLSLDDVATGGLTEIAYFDSYTPNNNTAFDGTWSNYPFFESGTIIMTDITYGLFVLRLSPTSTPISSFTYSIDEGTVAFNNTSSDAYACGWDFGDGSEISYERNPIHDYSKGGSYNVKLTVTNTLGSSETSELVSFVYTNVLTKPTLLDLSIYPNPAEKAIHINLGSPSLAPISVTIQDTKGKNLITKNLIVGQQQIYFDTQNFASGIYYVNISSPDHRFSQKIIVR